MVNKEAIKLYKHLMEQGDSQETKTLVIGNGYKEILAALEPLIGFGVNMLDELSEKQVFDIVLVVLDRAQVGDIQDFLQDISSFCHASTRVIFDWPAPWRRSLPSFLTPKSARMFAHSALSISDMQRVMVLAEYERVIAGCYELLPWSIPVLSWIFNSFLARVPFIAALCRRRWLVMRPVTCGRKASDVMVSVIVPCRNERGNIEAAITRTPLMGKKTEIIFVEGHSQDDTVGEIKRVVATYPNRSISWCVQPGKGKGDAVRAGFAAAQGDVLMILDADLTMPPEELPKFFNALVQNKGECINGSRLIYPMENEAMQTLNWWANHFFAALFSWLMGQRVTDTLCGTKVLWRKDYERIAANRAFFGEFDPFGDFDLLFGAAKLNLKIRDVPVHYKNRAYGSTQIRRFTHGLILLGMSLYAMRKLKFY